MRPIVRQSARLASCKQASHIRSASPTSIAQQKRTFYVSASRRSDARPSNSAPGHQTSVNSRQESQKDVENERETNNKEEQSAEQESDESKLANEARKAVTKRSLRQRRMNELPKPPPIPDWFLRHNVTLVEERAKTGHTKEVRTIRVVDRETGHTLFTVDTPDLEESPLSEGLSFKSRPRSGLWQDIPEQTSNSEDEKDPTKPITITLDGRAVDITALGPDPSSLHLLELAPEKLREAMVLKRLIELRAEAIMAGKEPSHKLTELLANLSVEAQHDARTREGFFISRVKYEEAKRGIIAVQNELDRHMAELRSERDASEKADDESKSARPIASKGALDQNFFDQRVGVVAVAGEGSNPTAAISSDKHSPPIGAQPDYSDRGLREVKPVDSESAYFRKYGYFTLHSLRAAYLEAELSIRAAFSLADADRPSALFATDRVDISLSCPNVFAHAQMDAVVHDLAYLVNADLIQLDANDLGELSETFVGQGDDTPGSIGNLAYEVFNGYSAESLNTSDGNIRPQPRQDNEQDQDGYDEDEDDVNANNIRSQLESLNSRLGGNVARLLGGAVIGIGVSTVKPRLASDYTSGRPSLKSSAFVNTASAGRDEARMDALFETMLDATLEKRASNSWLAGDPPARKQYYDRYSGRLAKGLAGRRGDLQRWSPDLSRILVAHLSESMGKNDDDMTSSIQFLASEPHSDASSHASDPRQTIVYLRDFYDIYSSKSGAKIIRRLTDTIKKRRRLGERIVLVGTTCQDAAEHVVDSHEDFPFRSIQIRPAVDDDKLSDHIQLDSSVYRHQKLDNPLYARILEINLRHIESMLRRMRPQHDIDMRSVSAYRQLNASETRFLSKNVLSIDQIQRLALIAIGLSQSYAKADVVQPVHVALAALITSRADAAFRAWSEGQGTKISSDILAGASDGKRSADPDSKETGEARIDRIKKSCNQHEGRLLSGVVDAGRIKVGFNDVHVPKETIDALKTLTSLSLLRPDAFKYGVLANDRLPGLLLYGPPGTGKTLLAKAVAKESRATVLEVSGAQIYEKYVGEGEKMVRAVFSLAKKLSPCVVFLDEADAIFGSRSNAGNRTTHREIINQFLREWDGMDDHGVFIMVASNRPFDLDDAVLRRLPRRLLVDLPVAKDRESILGIHLRDEVLDPSVSLSKLAEQTPLYSGSDLKNLAVAAALACVREENELSELRKDDTEFKLPEKRTLTAKHFEKALTEISASISEDMPSLTAIRKFDEQYGDRKGRRKKSNYGFGGFDGGIDESAAMVRQPERPSPPPP